MGLFDFFKRSKNIEPSSRDTMLSGLPPIEDSRTLPTCIEDFKEHHFKALRKLNMHAANEPFSGSITREVDIHNFITVAHKLGLIKLSSYPDSLYYLKNNTLKNILKNHQLKVSGNKKDLIDRITSNIDEIDVRKSADYSDFYILTEKGEALIEQSYIDIQTGKTNFFEVVISLIMDYKFEDAYRMICKNNAEKPIHPGMNCDWEKNYYRGLGRLNNRYEIQMRDSNNLIATAISIYINMSGESVQHVRSYLDNTNRIIIDDISSILYQNSLLSTERNFDSYNDSGIKKYRFLSALDENTCSICGKLDGKIFLVKDKKIGVNCPPMHKGCRCTITAVIDNYRPETRYARDPVTHKGRSIPYVTYSEWIKQYKT